MYRTLYHQRYGHKYLTFDGLTSKLKQTDIPSSDDPRVIQIYVNFNRNAISLFFAAQTVANNNLCLRNRSAGRVSLLDALQFRQVQLFNSIFSGLRVSFTQRPAFFSCINLQSDDLGCAMTVPPNIPRVIFQC